MERFVVVAVLEKVKEKVEALVEFGVCDGLNENGGGRR